MSRDIKKLKTPFRTQIKKLIQKAEGAGIPILVTDTTRTLAEQKELVRKGYSKTFESKHLIGEAVDIAFQKDSRLSYDAKLYERLYDIVKDLPFVIWPYRDLGWKWDKPHFQYDKNKKMIDTKKVSRVEKLKAQVKRLHKEVRKLTIEVLAEKDKLTQEIGRHKETLEKLQACEKERESSGVLRKIRELLGL